MDFATAVLCLLLLVSLWRFITVDGSDSVAKCVQGCLHRCGVVSGLLQWYSLLLIGLAVMVLRNFYDIVMFEYTRYDWLLNDDLRLVPNLTASEKQDSEISGALRIF